jgi:hypothetical protein
MNGESYHARAELRRIRRESKTRDAMFKPSLWEKFMRWLGFR